ncbi:MAG: hypothetical protein KME21_22630 [Desmonostoc vinosum HA7617-LM4]|nr:hypothetical protein [Desmonostoc vinosum HA7617-LM4]
MGKDDACTLREASTIAAKEATQCLILAGGETKRLVEHIRLHVSEA